MLKATHLRVLIPLFSMTNATLDTKGLVNNLGIPVLLSSIDIATFYVLEADKNPVLRGIGNYLFGLINHSDDIAGCAVDERNIHILV